MSSADDFKGLINTLAENSHGVPQFAPIKAFMEGRFKKTAPRLEFLNLFLTQERIEWEKVKNDVWENEEKRMANKFHFIQGDIVETTRVEGLGAATSSIDHPLWLVISPDCDCVRSDFIRMAPIYAVNPMDKESYADNSADMSLAAKLKSTRLFPLGGDLFGDGMEGYFADLTEPFYLRQENRESVTVHFSLKEEGWHLLNAFLKESETRADIQEGVKVRRRTPPPAANVIPITNAETPTTG